ncbi:hypothetical protein PQR05_19715 [Paraburkholderia sediminicola]|uniref:hypothetical protein n=1 Tax=Paraburkholderia sediminicola TaxID=458836 RepID=UPI0038BC7F90
MSQDRRKTIGEAYALVFASYNATRYLQARHGAPAELMKAIDGAGALVQATAG